MHFFAHRGESEIALMGVGTTRYAVPLCPKRNENSVGLALETDA